MVNESGARWFPIIREMAKTESVERDAGHRVTAYVRAQASFWPLRTVVKKKKKKERSGN